VEKG
jgi:hypothetical protein